MFREMRRFKQQVSDEECIEILKTTKRGVLSVIGDDGYPYGIPINHYYCEDDGKIYFHGAKAGHKIDAIKSCDKASFCVYNDGYRKEGDWALNITSVITFGRIHLVEDEATALKICSELTKKFTDDDEYLKQEIQKSFRNVQCLELIPEHITGKLVNES
ncbi:MAG: pyridoxamine 5'-phosphate oxidase family protein [Pseudobutyrivibrio ruminis]|uniref:pyridoxamine 5'-phosphate oxidase family protein n=1 Tax=Pseudobutyrivibrio ruminis TaxID=46206 RepID=UPI0026EFAF41|nr:pyridoxamine 5'-phosphate oxidase family protein [Pseudobutyrivibrio ruminis]MBE5914741.1 pyridoxamine 5'-phosphate oxidase family protein [Pseudobutyrivibrio ruminis]